MTAASATSAGAAENAVLFGAAAADGGAKAAAQLASMLAHYGFDGWFVGRTRFIVDSQTLSQC